MVETRNRILSKAKLALRPMTILASSLQRQASLRLFRFVPTTLTPLPLAQLEVCMEQHKKLLTAPTTLYTGLSKPLSTRLSCILPRRQKVA